MIPALPTKWQCHLCQTGPHLTATTKCCTGVLRNGKQCGQIICDQCITDDDIPGPLSHPMNSHPDTAVLPSPSDNISIMSSNFGDGEVPEVSLVGYAASNASNETLFKGILDTGASVCIITDTAASRIGADQIDSSKSRVLLMLGEKLQTKGQVRIIFRLTTSHRRYSTLFDIIPDNGSHSGVDAVLSGRVSKRILELDQPGKSFEEQLRFHQKSQQEKYGDSNEEKEGVG
jgi:hypothetical protein